MFSPTETNFQSASYLQWASDTWPTLPLSIAAAYLWFVYMVQHPYLRKTTVAVWDFLLSIFSLCGTVRVVPALLDQLWSHSFHQTLCLYPDYLDKGPVGMWSMLFVFSKVMELLGTVFLVWENKPLIFFHWCHHLTVLLLFWHAYVSKSPIGLHVMAMNYSIHTVMYGYYFLRSVGSSPPPRSHRGCPVPSCVPQGSSTNFLIRSASITNMSLVAIVYYSYFYLFVWFFSKKAP